MERAERRGRGEVEGGREPTESGQGEEGVLRKEEREIDTKRALPELPPGLSPPRSSRRRETWPPGRGLKRHRGGGRVVVLLPRILRSSASDFARQGCGSRVILPLQLETFYSPSLVGRFSNAFSIDID